jgi:hypothetical protein
MRELHAWYEAKRDSRHAPDAAARRGVRMRERVHGAAGTRRADAAAALLPRYAERRLQLVFCSVQYHGRPAAGNPHTRGKPGRIPAPAACRSVLPGFLPAMDTRRVRSPSGRSYRTSQLARSRQTWIPMPWVRDGDGLVCAGLIVRPGSRER